MTTTEAAAYLRSTKATLETWRYTRTGPPYVKSGARVFYRQPDLDGWLAAQTVQPRPAPVRGIPADAPRIHLQAREPKRRRQAS